MKDRTLTIQQFADSELVAELQRRGGMKFGNEMKGLNLKGGSNARTRVLIK